MTPRAVRQFVTLAIFAQGLMSPAIADDAGHGGSMQTGPIPVTVSIVPQQWLVDSIGGDHVSTSVMVEPGAFPGTYEPKPSQMRSLSESEVYFSIGVPFEDAWLARMRDAAPDMRMIDMAERVKRRSMGGGYSGDGEAFDPHVWLSPMTMRTMASTVLETLTERRPGSAEDFRRNYAATIATINAVDADIAKDLASVPERTFMVFHPVWGYLADSYGLDQLMIEVDGDEPSPKDMRNIIDAARAHNIRVIFVQPQVSQRSARAIAENLGGEVQSLDPLAYDWPENMRSVGATFADTLR